MPLTGELFIGGERVARDGSLKAVNPATGETLEPAFSYASLDDVEKACQLAWDAFDAFRETDLAKRADFLDAIADEIMAAGDELVQRGVAETGLPQARLEGERGRTTGQLRLFAEVVRKGDWLGVRVDTAMPDRAPLPRPDLRQRKVAVGPVVVFGASNFPLAFSVAGGDTASAFAAGCPVIVKGHSAHPGLSELVGAAITRAAEKTGMPKGVFSLVNGGRQVGTALVADARVKAVGFTGSRVGGLALAKVAQERAEPIPVYAEMSSINPVVLCPAALKARAEDLGAAFVGSLTMGAGQFCTNPGLVIGIAGPDLDRFITSAGKAVSEAACQVMLTSGIHDAYSSGVAALADNANVEKVSQGPESNDPNRCRAALFAADAKAFLGDEALTEEVFGSSSLVIRCADENELKQVLENLEGQLTATLHMDADDYDLAGRILPTLERKSGRILANGWPTGVEVCHAMVHGGPFPATSDTRTTSVGTLAIERFLRPVCYQALPDALLPAALKSDNPLNVNRLHNGEFEKG